MTERILLIATVINALAAGWSAWFAYQTVQTAREQRGFQELERQEKRYERYIEVPLREYLTTLSTEWYTALDQGLGEIDTLIANRTSTVEIAAYSRRLTFSLREIWRRASFNLLTGAGMWDRALSREMEIARDELEKRLGKILKEHVSKAVPGRIGAQYSLNVTIRDHSAAMMDMFAKYAPRQDTPRPIQGARRLDLLGPGGGSAKDQV